MTSKADFVQPPRIAVWLVNLFTPAKEAESILGDLLEEFSELASKSGVTVAGSWYWRQTAKTIAHLAASGFRVTPWSTAAAVVGGSLLLPFVSGLPGRAIFAVLHRYPDGVAIGHVIASMFVGCLVALAAKSREMVATLTLGLFLCATTVASLLLWVVRGHGVTLLWLPWGIADWLAIVVGGVIVRTLRSGATYRSRTT